MTTRWVVILGLTGCGVPEPPAQPRSPQPNILVVVLDDVGAYELDLYDPAATFHTPVLDQLAAEGLTFQRAWSMPLCAPARASALTGRYGRRTGMGTNPLLDEAGVSLPDAEVLWPEQLRATSPERWRFGAVGKWHIASWPDGGGARVLAQGFDTYLGALGNVYDRQSEDGVASDYFSYEKYYNTVAVRQQVYLTLDETDDAIRLAQRLPQPWGLWVGLHAAHEPYHEPPTDVLPDGPTTIPDLGQRALFGHMVESADAELGRLLAAIPADTHVIVVGDNGSPRRVGPTDRSDERLKDSVYEGGVRVPMIVRSPLVAEPGSRTDALVVLADILPTLVELGGGSVDGLDLDGRSLVGLLAAPEGPGPHEVAYTEVFEPNGPGPYTRYDQAIRDDRYKLIRTLDGDDQLFRMDNELRETANLLPGPLSTADQAAYERLGGRLDRGEL